MGGSRTTFLAVTGDGSIVGTAIRGIAQRDDQADVGPRVRMAHLPRPEDVPARSGLTVLPRRPAAAFVGREYSARRLRDALCRDGTVVITQAEPGPGGIGKSELALRYADDCRDRYRLVGWITASSAEHIGAGLAALAVRIHPCLGPTVKTAVAIDWALGWLRTHDGWLLVLDDAEDVELVESLAARLDSGHIVITSRRSGWGGPAAEIKLEPLAPRAASELVLTLTGAVARDPGGEPVPAADQEVAGRIAAELDHLPLALEQAAAYIRETGIGLGPYLELLRARAASTAETSGAPTDETGGARHRAVARVWEITRSALAGRDPGAVRLLHVLAGYAPEVIPRELIAPGEVGDGDVAVNAALDLLATYGMIGRDAASDGGPAPVVLHRSVQSALAMDAEADPEAGPTALDWLVRAIPAAPDSDVAGWPLWRRLTPHIETVARQCAGHADSEPLGVLLNETALFYWAQGAYPQALTYCEQALAVTERTLGPDHPDVSAALARLAEFYRKLGRLPAALPLAARAVTIAEQALGPDHLDIAAALGALAGTHRELGLVAEALPTARRALTITERLLGPDHPRVARALADLALIYKALGRAADALPLEERALAITETALGADRPEVAIRLGNLASTYVGLGRAADALPLEERALTITETALGADHPDVAVRLGNLASIYSALGRAADALPLEERALGITEGALGADHPHVATALGNLASTYAQLGRVAESLPLEERALAITEDALGPNHPHVATAMGNLALTCKALDLVGEALPLEERALAITEDALGADHPDVAIRLGNLAGTYRMLGWADESLPLEKQVLAIIEGALGAHHPDVATALGNLASSYSELGLAGDALPLEERALAITEGALGADHPDVAIRLGNLAFTYHALGRVTDAQAGARRAYICALASLGSAHPTTEWAERLCRDLGVALEPD
ncbi:MAG TPA: FxSxx-COOH system tetratricopeptide repeat protein [Streptosporangiaceae bacterium]|jgi:tetratricopeptide (TPR) repeat protein|nr:FxSxx-COOH system tetratricopeptide repeat protein [Streptosporangiaceae bacterium]